METDRFSLSCLFVFIEDPELEGTHKDPPVQLLGLHRTSCFEQDNGLERA